MEASASPATAAPVMIRLSYHRSPSSLGGSRSQSHQDAISLTINNRTYFVDAHLSYSICLDGL